MLWDQSNCGRVRLHLQNVKWTLPCDRRLDVLFVGLSKQVEETAREVVGVGVRVPQLIGDAIEEQVP